MTNYVNKPGGVLLHMEDGQVKYHAYGAEVNPKDLADYQRKSLGDVTDNEARSENPLALGIRDAHRAAVSAESGQVNSTSSPIPANYHELDEDGAVALIRALEAFPAVQAKILLFERVNKGREKVADAASDEARDIAESEYDNLTGGSLPEVDRIEQLYARRAPGEVDETDDSNDDEEPESKAKSRRAGSRRRAAEAEGENPDGDGDAPPPAE